MSLITGMETADRVELTISLTSIRSEGVKGALISHFVRGAGVKTAAALNGVEGPNVTANIDKLNAVDNIVSLIKDLDWPAFQSGTPILEYSDQRFKLMLKLTSVKSESVIGALRSHLIHGMTDTEAAKSEGLTVSNLRRSIKLFVSINETIKQIEALDWERFKV